MEATEVQTGAPIVVKFLAKKLRPATVAEWRRQLPDAAPRWGRCEFVFDADVREYDWLVVFDDLSPLGDQRFSTRVEPLACPRERTILVTAEPSCIKAYGIDYCNQFGLILTSQETWAMPFPHAVFVQTGYPWFYGRRSNGVLSYDRIRDNPPAVKTEMISTVCSAKSKGARTLYAPRLAFTRRLEQALPELQRFGKGVRFVDDKAEALDPFRYHVAIENDRAPHYFTEKLTDAFLALSLPFYHGCPNAADYFPEQSFIAIDVFDFEGSLATIRRAMADGEYERRRPHLLEARRRVMEEHNLFALLSREIEQRHGEQRPPGHGGAVYSRRALRGRSAGHLLRSLLDRYRVRRARRRHASS